MAKTQPKIDDIKDLKKATDVSDGLMSKEDKIKLDDLDYEDLGDMPVATNTEVGGIKLGFTQGLNADLLDDKHASDFSSVGHDHDTTYLGKSAQALDSAKLGGQLPSYYEPAFTKNTAFNKAFGTGSSDVARGDHGHSDLHSHSNILISFLGDLPESTNLWDSEMGVSFLGYGNTYYNTPNPICGTDASSTTIEGFLTRYNYGDQNVFTFHDVRTNIMYISSNFWDGDKGETIWNDWKRLLTCLDTTDVIEQEGEEYVFTIERDTEIYIPSGEKEFDSKNDTIIIDVSNILIGGTIHFKVYFSVPITGAININIETNDSNPRTYSTFYVDPTTIPSSQINSGIEYRVWRYPTYWYIMNRIF